jgi:hypothetical protein
MQSCHPLKKRMFAGVVGSCIALRNASLLFACMRQFTLFCISSWFLRTSSQTGCAVCRACLQWHQSQTKHSPERQEHIMNQTTKALVTGSVVAALGLAAAVWMVPQQPVAPADPVVKLGQVVVTAQRLPSPVVKLATVEVVANRADVLAAQALEQGKQAAASVLMRWN